MGAAESVATMSGTLYGTHKIQLDIFLWASVVRSPRVELGQKEMTPCAMHEEMAKETNLLWTGREHAHWVLPRKSGL